MPERIQLSDGDRAWVAELDDAQVTIRETGETFAIAGNERDGFAIERNGDGTSTVAAAAVAGDTVWVQLRGEVFELHVVRGAVGGRSASRDQDALSAPMPATVVRIAVKSGDRVGAGDLLIALEAMKMELPIRAPRDGVIGAIHCQEGELVQPGTQLLDLD